MGAGAALMKLPTPLPSLGRPHELAPLLRWAAGLLWSPRQRESDAAARMLKLIFDKCVRACAVVKAGDFRQARACAVIIKAGDFRPAHACAVVKAGGHSATLVSAVTVQLRFGQKRSSRPPISRDDAPERPSPLQEEMGESVGEYLMRAVNLNHKLEPMEMGVSQAHPSRRTLAHG